MDPDITLIIHRVEKGIGLIRCIDGDLMIPPKIFNNSPNSRGMAPAFPLDTVKYSTH
jgi:hypothetical protein